VRYWVLVRLEEHDEAIPMKEHSILHCISSAKVARGLSEWKYITFSLHYFVASLTTTSIPALLLHKRSLEQSEIQFADAVL